MPPMGFEPTISAGEWPQAAVKTEFPISLDSCRQPQTYVKPEAAITVLSS